jgi:hypothetical protein
MQEASDLLPPDAMMRILKLLQEARISGAYGFIQISVQNGYISGIGRYDNDKYPFKDKTVDR